MKLIKKIERLIKKTNEQGILLVNKKHWFELSKLSDTDCLSGYPVAIYGICFVYVEGLKNSPQILYKSFRLNFKGYSVIH